jgi:hypothetical protein
MLSKKKGHLVTNFDSILLVVTKDNNFFELQGLLEQNDFTNKPTTKNLKMFYMYQTSIIE